MVSNFSKSELQERIRLFEVLAVVLTAVGKFVFMDFLNWRLPYVVIAILGWGFYIYLRNNRDPNRLSHWGFRKDTFKSALNIMLPFGLISVVAFFGIGYFQNTINWSWHIIPIFITYPIWGTIQQFLIIGIVAGNLNDSHKIKWNSNLIILLTAVLFSVVHYPSYWLMLGTFVLALFYGFVYLKVKNLYVMGLFHGWLGALFYYTVVGSDPFQEIFLKLF